MPRGKSKRGRRPKLSLSDPSIFSNKDSMIEISLAELQNKEENEVIEEEEYVECSPQDSIKPVKRLTEGEIDVDDAESEESDADDENTTPPSDGTPSISPSEKAAQICRLPSKHLSTQELALFPFLEKANKSLQDAFVIARNSACLMWVEDPSTQITPDRLVGFLVTSLSAESMFVMYEAGLTTSFQSPTKSTFPSSSMSSPVFKPTCTENENPRLNVPPTTWLPWSSPAARLNVERLAYLSVLFLERYGFINFGIFKVLSPPLTRAIPPKSHGKNISAVGMPVTPDKTASRKALPNHSVSGRRSLTASPDRFTNSNTPIKVIVCGAGIAGIMAARQLTYFGAKVTILEARDRLGGRIWTMKKGDKLADLGAMIVTGMSSNPIGILAQQASLTLQPVNSNCTLYTSSGVPVSHDKDEKMEEEFNRLLGAATHLCRKKNLDCLGVQGSQLSLGGVLEDLIRYQENHIIPLKKTHLKLVSVLLDRKTKILEQMSITKTKIEKAFNKWQQSNSLSPTSSIEDENKQPGRPRLNKSALQPTSTTHRKGEKRRTSSPHQLYTSDESSTSKRHATGHNTPCPQTETYNIIPKNYSNSIPYLPQPKLSFSENSSSPKQVIDVDREYESRKLLSELHQAWKGFDPLQQSLSKINRQLELLSQNQPRNVYLTHTERNLIDWHFANLEFANATELKNLSLRHWDQDDEFELSGAHCTIKNGFASLVDALTSNTTTVLNASNNSDRPPLKVDMSNLLASGSGPCGQIELKSSVKSIQINENSVTVEGLNAAFSQDEVISYKASAVLCTFPLGVIKESTRMQREATKGNQIENILEITAPYFYPPLPNWKIEAIERLGFGVLNKVVLFFDRIFWDKSQRSFGCVHDETEKRGELFLFWSVTDKPCLVGLVAGRAGEDLESEHVVSESQSMRISTNETASSTNVHLHEPIVARAMEKLRKIFNRDSVNNIDTFHTIPDPIDVSVTRWKSDIYSRGSYSYVGVDATGDDYDVLSEPLRFTDVGPPSNSLSEEQIPCNLIYPTTLLSSQIPRVYFAGEHTSRFYPASVHGALLTGLREAARIANVFFPGETPVYKSGLNLTPPSPIFIAPPNIPGCIN